MGKIRQILQHFPNKLLHPHHQHPLRMYYPSKRIDVISEKVSNCWLGNHFFGKGAIFFCFYRFKKKNLLLSKKFCALFFSVRSVNFETVLVPIEAPRCDAHTAKVWCNLNKRKEKARRNKNEIFPKKLFFFFFWFKSKFFSFTSAPKGLVQQHKNKLAWNQLNNKVDRQRVWRTIEQWLQGSQQEHELLERLSKNSTISLPTLKTVDSPLARTLNSSPKT